MDACVFVLVVAPRWPASVVFCREAWSDSMSGVPGKVRGVWRWQLQNVNVGTKRRRRKKGLFSYPLLMHQDLKLWKSKVKTFAQMMRQTLLTLKDKAGNILDFHDVNKRMKRPTFTILLPKILKCQICTNPHLKVVPNQCTVYSSLSHVCWKLQCFRKWFSLSFEKQNYVFVTCL